MVLFVLTHGTGLGSGAQLPRVPVPRCSRNTTVPSPESKWEVPEFVGGPYTATGVQEVAQVTGFSCRLALRCHHVAAVQHTRLDFSCSSDGIFVPPLMEETQGLHSALNFKIQE